MVSSVSEIPKAGGYNEETADIEEGNLVNQENSITEHKANKMLKSWLLLIGRLFVGIPLIVSATIHFAGPFFFYEAVIQYQMFEAGHARWVAAFIMNCSILLGTSVVFFASFRAAILSAGFLYCMFFLAQLIAIFRGLNISCGCFGATNHQPGLFTTTGVNSTSGRQEQGES